MFATLTLASVAETKICSKALFDFIILISIKATIPVINIILHSTIERNLFTWIISSNPNNSKKLLNKLIIPINMTNVRNK